MKLPKPKILSVGQEKLFIFDDILNADDIKKYDAILKHSDYTFLHSSRKDTLSYREWAATFSVNDFKNHPLHIIAYNAAKLIYPNNQIECYDVFCSASSFGDMTFIHNDSTNRADVSTLYYANSNWEPEWGGETIFYDENKEACIAVSNKPGRLIMFKGNILHRAGIPNRICNEIRTTLSTRFSLIDNK